MIHKVMILDQDLSLALNVHCIDDNDDANHGDDGDDEDDDNDADDHSTDTE